jgi:hypothetical protein
MSVRDRFRDLRDRVRDGGSSNETSQTDDEVAAEATEALEEAREDDGGESTDTTASDEGSDDSVSIRDVPDAARETVENIEAAQDEFEETVSDATNRDDEPSRQEENAERVAAEAEETARPEEVDVSDLPDGVRGQFRAAVEDAEGGVARSADRGRRLEQAQSEQQRQTFLDRVGLGGVDDSVRETVDEGATVSISRVNVPGTAGNVRIPTQRVEVSGEGLASFSDDVRETTGLPTGPPTSRTTRPVDTSDGVGIEDIRRVEAGEARFQQQTEQELVETAVALEEEGDEAGEDLPSRSLFTYAPASPVPATAVVGGASAVTGGGGATAGGTGAAGGGGTGTGAATATSSEVLQALALAGAAGVVSQTDSDGELPVGDRFGEPELETGDQTVSETELDIDSDGEVLGGSELDPGETGPQQSELEIADELQQSEIPLGDSDPTATGGTTDGGSGLVPDEFPLRDNRVNPGLQDGSEAPALSAQQLFRQREEPNEELDEDDDPFVIEEDDILDRRPEPDQAINNQRINQEPEIDPTVRGIRERLEEQDDTLQEIFQERSVEFGEETEPEVTVDEAGVETSAEDVETAVSTATQPTIQVDVTPVAETEPDVAQVQDTSPDVTTTPDVTEDTATDVTDIEVPDVAQPQLTLPSVTQPQVAVPTTTANPLGNPTLTPPEVATPNPPGFGVPATGTPGVAGQRPLPVPDIDDDNPFEEFRRADDELFSSGIASGDEIIEGDNLGSFANIDEDIGGL